MPSACGRIPTSSRCITTSNVTGSIVQINVSFGGIPKRPIAAGTISTLGLGGDACAHPQIHGGPFQAVLIIASETIEYLEQRGYPVFFGALGENLTTRGLDRRQLRLGQQLRAGGALLEITKVRGPCSALDVYGPAIKQEIYDQRVKAGDPDSPRWGMSGFYARVLQPGPVRPGDIISIEATLA
jgi:MOSC domain-containing protein YiiM